MNKTNIERYAQLCRQELHTFLGGELMRCDPSDMDDPEIILEADARSRRWTLEGISFPECSVLQPHGRGRRGHGSL